MFNIKIPDYRINYRVDFLWEAQTEINLQNNTVRNNVDNFGGRTFELFRKSKNLGRESSTVICGKISYIEEGE